MKQKFLPEMEQLCRGILNRKRSKGEMRDEGPRESSKKQKLSISKILDTVCADMQALIKEAAMQPVRELPPDQLLQIKDSSAIRPLHVSDFEKAIKSQPPSVSKSTIVEFDNWRKEKGQV